MTTAITSDHRRDPPELDHLSAWKHRQWNVHAPHAGQHGQRQKDGRDHRQHFHDDVQAIRYRRQVGVQDAADPVLEHDRLFGQPHELVVHIAKAVRNLVVDQWKLPARQPANRIALRDDNAPQRCKIALDCKNAAHEIRLHAQDRRFFERVDLLFQDVDLGPIVFDHRIDDPVHHCRGTLRQHVLMLVADHPQLRDTARSAVVHGHEVIAAQEEIDIVCREFTLRVVEVDAVKNQVKVAGIGFDFRRVNTAERILDRQRMEMEHVGQNACFIGARRGDIDPHGDARRRIKPRGIDVRNIVRLTVTVGVNRDHCCSRSASIPHFDREGGLGRRKARDRHAVR